MLGNCLHGAFVDLSISPSLAPAKQGSEFLGCVCNTFHWDCYVKLAVSEVEVVVEVCCKLPQGAMLRGGWRLDLPNT